LADPGDGAAPDPDQDRRAGRDGARPFRIEKALVERERIPAARIAGDEPFRHRRGREAERRPELRDVLGREVADRHDGDRGPAAGDALREQLAETEDGVQVGRRERIAAPDAEERMGLPERVEGDGGAAARLAERPEKRGAGWGVELSTVPGVIMEGDTERPLDLPGRARESDRRTVRPPPDGEAMGREPARGGLVLGLRRTESRAELR